jgi:hypothetical protein
MEKLEKMLQQVDYDDNMLDNDQEALTAWSPQALELAKMVERLG